MLGLNNIQYYDAHILQFGLNIVKRKNGSISKNYFVIDILYNINIYLVESPSINPTFDQLQVLYFIFVVILNIVIKKEKNCRK